MKNLEEQIALEVEIDLFGVFVATFQSAATKRLLGRANINMARQLARGPAESKKWVQYDNRGRPRPKKTEERRVATINAVANEPAVASPPSCVRRLRA